jgi:Icc-related predicted phosphoesterase
MKIEHITDTHQADFSDILQGADILVHTGDYSLLPKCASLDRQIKELREFNSILDKVRDNYKHILFCPGNHDIIFEKNPEIAKDVLKNATTLLDSGIEFEGIKFYGTPSQPIFGNWAFNHSEEKRASKYKNIPKDADVLLTHCPPYGIMDTVHAVFSKKHDQNVGCPLLKAVIDKLTLKLHCFGHIHCNNGTKTLNGVQYSNACLMNDHYYPVEESNIIKI